MRGYPGSWGPKGTSEHLLFLLGPPVCGISVTWEMRFDTGESMSDTRRVREASTCTPEMTENGPQSRAEPGANFSLAIPEADGHGAGLLNPSSNTRRRGCCAHLTDEKTEAHIGEVTPLVEAKTRGQV